MSGLIRFGRDCLVAKKVAGGVKIIKSELQMCRVSVNLVGGRTDTQELAESLLWRGVEEEV